MTLTFEQFKAAIMADREKLKGQLTYPEMQNTPLEDAQRIANISKRMFLSVIANESGVSVWDGIHPQADAIFAKDYWKSGLSPVSVASALRWGNKELAALVGPGYGMPSHMELLEAREFAPTTRDAEPEATLIIEITK